MKKLYWFHSYNNMMTRCYNEKSKFYARYGGRGIIVCDAWKGNPQQFYADMGDRLKHMSLDRIDVNGNYEPSNCKWSDDTEQARNRSNSVFVKYNGELMHINKASELSGINIRTLKDRIRTQNRSGDYLFAPLMSSKERTIKSGLSKTNNRLLAVA
jgi:hypothetical protein